MAALPIAAMVTDAEGTVLELNQAFIDEARTWGTEIRRDTCVGRPLASLAPTDAARSRLAAGLKGVVDTGTPGRVRWRMVGPSRRPLLYELQARAVVTEEGGLAGVLLLWEGIGQRARQAQLQTARQHVQEALWQMEGVEDLPTMMRVLARELQQLCPTIRACSVQLLDATEKHWTGYVILGEEVEYVPRIRVAAAVEACWRQQRPVYRPDLEADDPYGETGPAGWFVKSADRDHSARERSVLDVPFTRGTLAVNGLQPDAFAPEDIALVEEMARLLSVGFARVADLEQIGQRKAQLEQEVAERRRVEAALRVSEDRYRVFMDFASDQVFLKDGDHRYLLVNRATEAFLQRPLPEVLGHTDLELMPEAAAHRCLESDAAALRESGATVSEEPVLGRVYEVRKFRVPLGEGQVGIGGFVRDVTEQKRAERETAALLAVQRVRNEILEMRSAADWSHVLTVLHRELGALMGFHEIGYAVVHEDGSYEGHIVAADGSLRSDAAAQVPEAVARAVATQAPVLRRTRTEMAAMGVPLPLPAQSVVDVPYREGTFSANHTEEDAFGEEEVRLLSQFAPLLWEGRARLQDMEARQRAEEARRRTDEQYRLVVDHANEAIVVAQDGALRFVNPQASAVTGYSREELTARPFLDLIHPEDRPMVMERYERRLRGEELPGAYAFRLIDREGATRWVEISAVAISWEGRRATLNFLSDISERKQMEDDLIRLERLRVSGELAAGVAHNLNNILTAVLGPAQMLQRRSLDSESRRDTQIIVDGALRARDLIQRLSRAVRPGLGEALVPVSLNAQVRAAIAMARPRWKDEPEARGIAISMVTELGAVPAIRGRGDELGDALLNLLLNAVEAMPQGGTITVRTAARADRVHLEVTDTGVGMDEETSRRVFEPFFTTKRDVGSGLGLALVRGMVRRWGGSIEVESRLGEGTTFTLNFLVAPSSAESANVPPPVVRPGRPGRVLIVDDDDGVSGVLCKLLSSHHEVRVATNGDQALSQMASGSFDVALVDLGLPGLPGDEVAAQLRGVDRALATVLITGWVLEPGDERRSGFDFVLQKPFPSIREVEAVVTQAIALRGTRR